MTALDGLTRDYRVALLHYLPRREEAALNRGYELGRSAVADGVSILELVTVHHDVLLEVLRETPTAELPELATAASEFLLEALATFDMTHRGFLESHPRDEQGPPTGKRVQGSPGRGLHGSRTSPRPDGS